MIDGWLVGWLAGWLVIGWFWSGSGCLLFVEREYRSCKDSGPENPAGIGFRVSVIPHG
jgi:hypothetical protein